MNDEQNDQTIRYDFIRFVYIATAIMGTTTGLLILLVPDIARIVIGMPSQLPEQDPVVFGLVGTFWLAVALTSLLGLRAPLKFLPLFLLQLVYKSSWFLFVFIPMMVRGEFPAYGIAIAVGNAVWIALDLRAIPFRYLLAAEAIGTTDDEAGLENAAAPPSSPAEALQ
jgi:hypothetical protein